MVEGGALALAVLAEVLLAARGREEAAEQVADEIVGNPGVALLSINESYGLYTVVKSYAPPLNHLNADARKVGVDDDTCDRVIHRRFDSSEFDIAEAEERKARFPGFHSFATGGVERGGLGGVFRSPVRDAAAAAVQAAAGKIRAEEENFHARLS